MKVLCLVTPTLCDSMDCRPPGSSVHRILQPRILESVAMSFSRGSSQPRNQTLSPALQADSLPTSHEGSPMNVLPTSKPSAKHYASEA